MIGGTPIPYRAGQDLRLGDALLVEPDIQLADATQSILRRYEYFKYIRTYDEFHLPNSTFTGGDPLPGELGQFIAANRVAANLDVPEPSALAMFIIGGFGGLSRRWQKRISVILQAYFATSLPPPFSQNLAQNRTFTVPDATTSKYFKDRPVIRSRRFFSNADLHGKMESTMHVVFGYDGSDQARDAIMALHRAGLACDTQIRIVSVADAWPPLPQSAYVPACEGSESQQAPIVRKARALAAESLAKALAFAAEGASFVAREFPAWKVSHAAYAGSPYMTLIQPTESSPDLVVVGAHGGSVLERFMLGSVSQNVLTHATCSVRISRLGKRQATDTDAPIRIILGVDGSRHSALAVSAVASRTWPAGTEVKVVAVLDLKFWSVLANPGYSTWGWLDGIEEDGRSLASRAVEAVARDLRLAGLVVTPLVEEDDPKRFLVAEAKRWAADCIFVGAKGHNAVERILLGSVSASIAARAPCSVEVVRQG